MSKQLTFIQNVVEHVRAGYQILLVTTHEENRVEKELKEAAKLLSMEIAAWDHIQGYAHKEDVVNPTEALLNISNPGFFPAKHTMVVLKDMHNFYDSPDVRRALRGMSERVVLNNSMQRRPVILIQPTERTHPDLSSCITPIEFTLPTPAQLTETFETVQKSIKDAAKQSCTDELKYHIVQGLRGLTSTEAANCMALCLIRHGGFVPELIETIEKTKAVMLRKTEVLNYVPKDEIPPLEDLGGYDEMVDWVRQRSLAYTPQADIIKMDRPKGCLLIGVPGTGKSVAGMGVARALGLPLLEFDFSSVFNSLVGASEARVREVIKLVTAIDGCVLVIDEADKALGGSTDATGDSGVTRRVFGVLLTWLARKKDRTFVIMTMNRTKGMPPELLRKGRFDELFYVDLPSEEERRRIFEIHMRKRDIDPTFYDAANWTDFAQASNECVGSEIEEAVKSARFVAFQLAELRRMIDESSALKGADKTKMLEKLKPYSTELKSAAVDLGPDQYAHMAKGIPTVEQLKAAIADIAQTRITVVDKAAIEEIREFGQKRARPVSRERKEERKPKKKASRNVDLD